MLGGSVDASLTWTPGHANRTRPLPATLDEVAVDVDQLELAGTALPYAGWL